MAIRFGSSDPKIWLRFCLHLTPMIIRYIRKRIYQRIFGHTRAVTAMHKYAFCVYLCSCPNASGGRYSLAEAVNNPVHAEHSEGCAGMRDNTSISRASGGRYLAMSCAVPSSRRMRERAWSHCPSTPALRFGVPGY